MYYIEKRGHRRAKPGSRKPIAPSGRLGIGLDCTAPDERRTICLRRWRA
jgi:hypothetical protein